jgi:3-hydroxyacyl-CoA dehydrogenase/enoyl-CoA hydratase/3-hydroxybutyryl-CoA epimerase/enoyl-CoA isomerase
MDHIGMDNICAMASKYESLGALYHPTEKMKEMAKNGQKYFPQERDKS